MSVKNIGIPGVAPPTSTCDDPHCPFHGSLPVRGRMFTGKVKKAKMTNALTVQINYIMYDNKYQRYERRNTKMSVHCPPCIEAKVGDTVKFIQCRKISKTISSVVIQIMESNQ